MLPEPQSCLVIRRDNIGDLVCTTPVFAALRERFPKMWLGALVNSYTAPVLAGNPHLDAVFSYRKAKHRVAGESALGIYWRTWRMLLGLRRRGIDLVILASPGRQASAEHLAAIIRPAKLIAFDHPGARPAIAVSAHAGSPMHQVESTYRILQPLGIVGHPPPLTVIADEGRVIAWKGILPRQCRTIVGVHISAREQDRRWPDQYFSQLLARLLEDPAVAVVLTWAPGSVSRKEFRGDDESARLIVDASRHARLVASPTAGLEDLVASLAVCDVVICSDGGPVHLAAALRKPVVALFGSERAELWHPWGVPYRLLQKPSLVARDIAVGEVFDACVELLAK